MAIIRQRVDPLAGKIMTTRGFTDHSVRLCYQCGEKKSDDLFTMNANGQFVCPDCAGSKGEGVLKPRGDEA